MTCGEYVENMLIFAQYSTHILSNQQLVTSTEKSKIFLLTLKGPQKILNDYKRIKKNDKDCQRYLSQPFDS